LAGETNWPKVYFSVPNLQFTQGAC